MSAAEKAKLAEQASLEYLATQKETQSSHHRREDSKRIPKRARSSRRRPNRRNSPRPKVPRVPKITRHTAYVSIESIPPSSSSSASSSEGMDPKKAERSAISPPQGEGGAKGRRRQTA